MYNLSEASNTSEYFERKFGEQQNKGFLLALHHAIQNDELSLEYQPRYDSFTGHSTIFEALVRWHRKDVGTVYPDEFIDKAIEHGLIFDLDLWVFKRCCSDLLRLRAEVDKNIKIALNISPLECESLHHTQTLLSTCESYGQKMSDFEFEITESTPINDVRKVKIFCNTVIERGATISLNDLGACFSPLNNLGETPISYIKIDRSFVKKIGYGGRSDILIKHLIKLAHEMNIKVVAGGIEHAYQRDHLIKMGCDLLQGFFMCNPLGQENLTSEHIDMCLV